MFYKCEFRKLLFLLAVPADAASVAVGAGGGVRLVGADDAPATAAAGTGADDAAVLNLHHMPQIRVAAITQI